MSVRPVNTIMTKDHHRDAAGAQLVDMALRMQYLLATVPKADGVAYTVEEVADGTSLSLTYLRNMLAGRQDNPSRKVIAALARFFRVSPAYFFEAQDSEDAERQAPTSEIELTLRSAERLGPEGRQLLLDMIRLAQRITRHRNDPA